MRMYSVIVLPMAEEDIISNTDYIAFEKKAPETALQLAIGFRNAITRIIKSSIISIQKRQRCIF